MSYWRWRCKIVISDHPEGAVQAADDFLARLAEQRMIPYDEHGIPVPATVTLNPSGISATITYYGDEIPE